ncbi:tRNA-dihydrouridine synthase [Bacillus pumilus]
MCKLHLDRLIDLKGEHVAVREMRKHAAWYLKGVRGNADVRNQINQSETRAELVQVLDDFTIEAEAKELQSIKVG